MQGLKDKNAREEIGEIQDVDGMQDNQETQGIQEIQGQGVKIQEVQIQGIGNSCQGQLETNLNSQSQTSERNLNKTNLEFNDFTSKLNRLKDKLAVFPHLSSAVPPHLVSAVSTNMSSAVTSNLSSTISTHMSSAVLLNMPSAVTSNLSSNVSSHLSSPVSPHLASAVLPYPSSAVSPHLASAVPPYMSSAVPSHLASAVLPYQSSTVESAYLNVELLRYSTSNKPSDKINYVTSDKTRYINSDTNNDHTTFYINSNLNGPASLPFSEQDTSLQGSRGRREMKKNRVSRYLLLDEISLHSHSVEISTRDQAEQTEEIFSEISAGEEIFSEISAGEDIFSEICAGEELFSEINSRDEHRYPVMAYQTINEVSDISFLFPVHHC